MDQSPTPPDANAGQIEYWNGPVGSRWAVLQERLDQLFAGVTEAAIARATPRPGGRVLDIGCGCGATVLALARRVGPAGRVLGVDISQVMLDVAKARIAAEGLTQAEVLVADAATHAFTPQGFDAVFSRFGVMFFDAPTEAFINIHRALRPGAALFFACWRPFAENPWFAVPYWAAQSHLPEQPPVDPDAPGPFAFADAARVETILEAAGFEGIEIERYDTTLRLAGSGRIEEALQFVGQIGPVSRALATVSDSERAAAEAAIRDALAEHDGPDGIDLGASLWFVSAKA